MDIVDTAEHWRWNEETDEGEFSHTVIVATDEIGNVFFTKVQDRQTNVRRVAEHQWFQIPLDHIYPILLPDLSIFGPKVDKLKYHKRPRFVTYDGSSDLAETLLREAEVYQLLQSYNSPFIAQYHGCVVSENRIIGLALTKYDQTLDARMKQHFGLAEATKWLKQIHQGIELIHSNGLAHNDLSPWNVMISDENAVIIDFDACRPLGEGLIKCGTPGWSDDDAQVSAIANDVYSLRQIAAALGVSTDKSTTTEKFMLEDLIPAAGPL